MFKTVKENEEELLNRTVKWVATAPVDGWWLHLILF